MKEFIAKQKRDPFFKYFKRVPLPTGGETFERRLETPPTLMGSMVRDPGVTREAADIYRQKTGRAYEGTLLPISKDPTYKTSSFGKADAAKAQAEARNFRRTASQKTLFGGNIRDLFPSLKRSLARRTIAKKQVEKQGQTLGA